MNVDISIKILFKSPFAVLPDDAVNTKLPSSEMLLWFHFHLYSYRLNDQMIYFIDLYRRNVTQLFQSLNVLIIPMNRSIITQSSDCNPLV